jgi:hypothetical protein
MGFMSLLHSCLKLTSPRVLQLYRDVHEAETDGAFPDGTHGFDPSAQTVMNGLKKRVTSGNASADDLL